MSVIDTLITDRTEQDVIAVKNLRQKILEGTATAEEITDFANNPQKGCYNCEDINRVLDAMVYLKSLLAEFGITVNITISTSHLGTTSIPQYFAAYLQSISNFRNAVPLPDTVPQAPSSIDYFTYKSANDIEEILKAVYDYAVSLNYIHKRSGSMTAISGIRGLLV